MFNFIVFLSIIVTFIVPLAFLIYLRDGGKSVISPFILGILIYLIGNQGLSRLFLKLFEYLPGDAAVLWSNKWFYGIVMGLTTGFFIESARFVILIIRNMDKRWTSSARRNAVLGLGEGWISGIFCWGSFMFTVAIAIFKGNDVDSFGLEIMYMICLLLEQIISVFLFIALSFLAQYAIRSKKANNYYFLCGCINAFSRFLVYAVTYIFNVPMIVTEILYAIFTALIFAYGYILIKSLHSHRRRVKRVHSNPDNKTEL